MEETTTTREKVLKRIRNALISKTPNPYPEIDMGAAVHEPVSENPDVTFAEELTNAGGNFIYCENMDAMLTTLSLLMETNNLKPLACYHDELSTYLKKSGIHVEKTPGNSGSIKASITFCEYLLARTGTVMVSSRSGPGRQANIFPDVHIVLARASQLVPDIKQAFAALNEKYGKRLPSMVSLITGPSRTADIEKTLIMGAHGPKELYVLYVDDLNQ
jgi:L-lactate dehydrogenase complex protein LldG